MSAGEQSATTARRDHRLLLPVSEVARMLGVSRSTVVRACDDGEFPVVVLRGLRRVPSAFVYGLVAAATPGQTVVAAEHTAAWNATSGAVA